MDHSQQSQSNYQAYAQGSTHGDNQRIDLNSNSQPDYRKRNDLKKRLYDSGISNVPMPSVKRPIEDKISSNPFSARMNSSKIQCLSPLKKKIQELNTNIIENLNATYEEAKVQAAKYQGEGTEDYYRSQQIVVPTPSFVQPSQASRKLQGSMGVSTHPRMTAQLLNNRKAASIMPLTEEYQTRADDKLKTQFVVNDPQKIMAGPPSLVYAGFEGSTSLSQKNLELARSKFLLDKITGKLPKELRSGKMKSLPPIGGFDDTKSQQSASQSSIRKNEKPTEAVKPDVIYGNGHAEQKTEPKVWSDLDKYIELLLDSKSEEETVFMYLLPNLVTGDPYDLQVTNYAETRIHTKYYTLSGKGLTLYENQDTPVEFISLGQWLIERDSYNHIKELSFFKQFKKWKFMRMWKKTIKQANRNTASNLLDEKLFILQDFFGPHLFKHRRLMIDMQSQLKFVDVCQTGDVKTIAQFAEAQQNKRNKVEEEIKIQSNKSRQNIQACMTSVLESLRGRIISEISLDEQKQKYNPIQSSNTVGMKRKEANNAFEKLNFPQGMTYGHRSSLRKECSRFLRFAYLVDFISLEALANIYKNSVEDMINRLFYLDAHAAEKLPDIMKMEFDEASGNGQAQRGYEPLFHLNVHLNDSKVIPIDEIGQVPIEDFILPPRGTSTEDQFDLLAHLELEPIKSEEEQDEEDAAEAGDVEIVQLYKKTLPNIHNFWIKLEPDATEFKNQIQSDFNKGLEKIQCFIRWSQHGDLKQYADALEEWDDIVGEKWEEPDEKALALNPLTWISDQEFYQTKDIRVNAVIDSAYKKANHFLARFQPILEIYWRNKQFDINILVDERLKNAVENLSNVMKLFKFYQQHFQSNLPSCTDIGLLQLDSKVIKNKLQPTPKEFNDKIEVLVPEINKIRTNEAKEWLSVSIADLKKPVANVEEFVEQKGRLTIIDNKFQSVRDKVDLFGQFYGVLQENGLNKPRKEDLNNHSEANTMITNLNNIISALQQTQEAQDEKFKKTLQSLIPELNTCIDNLCTEAVESQFFDIKNIEADKMPEIIKQLDAKMQLFTQYQDTSNRYNDWQNKLSVPTTNFDNLEDLRTQLVNRHLMWHSLQEWSEKTEEWKRTAFNQIDAPGIAKQAEKYAKICKRIEGSIEANPIQQRLKFLVEQFEAAMPIVIALRNENMQDSHRAEINELTGVVINIDAEGFTLQTLLEMNVVQFMDQIVAKSVEATGQAKLRTQLVTQQEIWKGLSFTTKNYKEKDTVFILAEIDLMWTALDEGIAAVNMILGNRFVKVMRAEAEKLKKDLVYLSEAVNEWVELQRKWCYLENIFTSGNIKVHLPDESKQFDIINKSLGLMLGRVNKNNKCANFIRPQGATQVGVVEQLHRQNEEMDKIQKKLDTYVDTKRQAFPRFYFLSQDDLIQILSNSESKEIISLHLKTLYDGIVALEFKEDQWITKMYSKEKECVELNKTIRIKGQPVETWLSQLTDEMKATVYKKLKDGQKVYSDETRKEWVLQHPGQVVATVAQIQWCSNTEEAIAEMPLDRMALQTWWERNDKQIEQLTFHVRSNLTELQRHVIVALITTDVHARDIIEELKREQVLSIFDFNWQKQLRYYYNESGDIPCSVNQIQATLNYGGEYMGATSRLVITPLTDRCWITITGALHIKLGANPAGPAGTGKTESTKDLAKAIAILCIVFNCSDQVDYILMGKLFSGLAQAGAWACLDEFNRIKVEVLSVIAQQILQIRNALLLKLPKTTANFEDKQITILEEFGCHITMNPGYAGRAELPDNLKVLFRPVAMMIPDYGLIAEIMLGSEGFSNAKILSKKMVQLYKLSSEQLSQQDHYDFGMRAVKSVLVMAGSLKRANPDINEDAVLIRAMRDANVPKFLKDDLPLFAAIIQDLFPTVQIVDPDYSFLLKQIAISIKKLGFQDKHEFMEKVIYLFETFNVRFGVMLVGPTGGGKTTCYEVLADVMTQLRLDKHPDQAFQIVNKKIFNPKAITMGELYGEVDFNTQDWTDGLASKIMRAASQEQGEEKSWTIFDGPVDAIWIENMNTVLDDNMTLCLSNGQRIKLRPQMRMLFEVMDLAVASPATVSRCGMVYLTAEQLGWLPYYDSWVQRILPDDSWLDQEMKNYLRETLIATVDVGIEKIRSSFNELIKTDNLQLVKSTLNFLQVFLNPDNGFKQTDPKQKKKDFDAILGFSYAWGMGAALDERSKDYFDTLVKDLFKPAQFPAPFTVFDYYYDLKKSKTWMMWDNQVQKFEYVKDMSFFDMMVPTADTYKHRYCLEQLLSVSKCVFFTGQTGVGKSVTVMNTMQILSVVKEGTDAKPLVGITINFSAQTMSLRVQQSIEEKLEKSRTQFRAPPGKRVAIFIDDINMPSVEEYGAQPPIELLRLLIDKSGMYDRKEWEWKGVLDTTLIAAAAPPSGGRAVLTPRFTTHFNVFCMPQATQGVLAKIFSSILDGFLKGNNFQEQVIGCSLAIIDSTIEIYHKISEELRATPAKFHYVFNLRDVSKVIQGILMSTPKSIQSADSMQRLWVNEVSRIFGDRLINQEDMKWFTDIVLDMLSRSFRSPLEFDDLFGEKKVIFSDILKIDAVVRLYEEVRDMPKLLKTLQGYLDEFNISSSVKMNLVFFEDAILHLMKILRALRQPRGNIMLIGVGGSGKQSLIKLGSYIYSMEFKQLEITKGFGVDQFREFIKDMMFATGVNGRSNAFTLTDSQILSETFLEDINNLLNTGEIPNLLLAEDKDRLQNDLRNIITDPKKVETTDLCNQLFIARVREYLHICLCMSPVGDDLRVRCRKFPSLVNCCTLDWFSRWPEEALLYVSRAFLKNLELPSEDVRKNLAEMCMVIHTSVEDTSEQFFNELRRRVYTTPKSYLDLINIYLSTLRKKRAEINANRSRLANGLTTLKNTNASIAELRVQITKMLPELAKKNEELAVTLTQVNKDKAIADEKDKVVSAEKEEVEKQAAEAKIVKDEADSELAQALPILEGAQKCVASLDQNSIVELKALNNPPPAVEMVMACVMVMMDKKGITWADIRNHIKNPMAFMTEVRNFDVNTIKESTIKKVRETYFKKPEYNPKEITGKSVPAGKLCEWSLALSQYQLINKNIIPKKEKAAEMDKILKEQQAILFKKLEDVREIKEKVAALVANANKLQAEKEELEFRMNRDQARMGRAEKLVVLLADEAIRWKETVEMLDVDIHELVGNVFLSCACISYFGAFTGVYRKRMTEKWTITLKEKKIPCSDVFSLVKVMGDPVVIRGWCIDGLPTDNTSCENAILTTKADRWALCIDPQQQANKWLKNMHKKEKMQIMKFGKGTFLREMSAAVNNGYKVLVEDVQEEVDPSIDPILMRSEFMGEGGIKQIKLGDATQDYDDNFRLYMTTKMPNPHYPPEICIKVTLINFTVTFEGLEEQLLGDVVIKEKPEVEAQRDKIVIQMAADKSTLKNIENTILKMLTESTEEQILDEDTLINVLEDSKITSSEINSRIAESTIVEQSINETRLGYKEVAVRGSILYFVIADMALINDMYQNSLQFVKTLFNKAIDAADQGTSVEERLSNLISMITSLIFTNISRGLFERDKLIFSFLICTSINRNCKKIDPLSWNLLLRGTQTISDEMAKKKPLNPLPKNILNDLQADFIYSAEVTVPDVYAGLTQSFADNSAVWLEWAQCEQPHIDPLPLDWQEKLTDFQKLIVLKAFRPEKIAFAFQMYVLDNMGKFYIEFQSASMEVVYADTDYKTPLIFILSTGADPTAQLLKFAQSKNYMERFSFISLGQGQGEKAKKLIDEATKNGNWVMLQNCHLAQEWMGTLEQIVMSFTEKVDVDPDFRLFLTSMPANYFPVAVLQNGVKLTTEPPRGIKANLKRGFNEMTDEYLDGCKKAKEWRKLIFGLSFFHAVIQERRKFGPLGWNILYDFNDSDLETSLVMLKLFLDDQEEIPWDALVFVTGHINYGGRVTDDNDRRCLLTTLQRYYCVENLEDGYIYSDSGRYYCPPFGNLQSYKDYIDTLPIQDGPEVFGLHENANISYQKQESDNTLETVLSIQSRVATGAGGMTPDQIVLAKVKQLMDELPALLDRDLGKKEQFKQTNGLLPSLTTVLVQEMEKFNRMLRIMRNSLSDLEKAIHGFISMSEVLDNMYLSLQNGVVPANWGKVAYPSLKPLASWYIDLKSRVIFMDDWLQNGTPKSYWISGLFFPQGFMTGCLQTHSRMYKIPIDKLQFSFSVLEAETIDDVDEAPEDGVYVHGFYLDGARYNRDEGIIDDQIPAELYNKMPLIWFKPVEDYVREPDEYACPCYKTGKRAGVLSTTGQSTNFIIHVDMPTKVQPSIWLRRAAAMLCQLND